METIQSMRDMGATDEMIASILPQRPTFQLWPQFKTAWEAFLHVSHQWRYKPNGSIAGLDYPQVEAGWRLAGVSVSAADWKKIRVIEAEVINLMQPENNA
jgi:hypothetical protein